MKIALKIVCILSILCITVAAAGKSDSRLLWWSQHLNNLNAEKQKLSGSADDRLISAIEREINGASQVLSTMKAVNENPESLIEERRRFSDTEIYAMAKDIASLHAKINLITRLNTGVSNDEVNRQRKAVRSAVYSMIDRKFTGDIEGLTDAIVKEDISEADWKRFDEEIFFESMMAESIHYGARAVAYIAAWAEQRGLANKENTQRGIKKLLSEEAQKYFKENRASLDTVMPSAELSDLLQKTMVWEEVKERLERNFQVYTAILNMNPNSKRIPVSTVRYYHKKPRVFAAFIANQASDETINNTGLPIALRNASGTNINKEKFADFIAAVESLRDPSGQRLAEIYRDGISRSDKRASFAVELYAECAKLHAAADFEMQTILIREARKTTGKLFLSPVILPAFDVKWAVSMDNEQISSLRKRGSVHEASLEKYRKDINISCRDFSLELNNEKKQDADILKRSRITAARHEVYEITRALDDYRSLAKEFTYSEGAFRRYADYYNTEYDNARSARLTPDVKRIIESKTIIPYVDDFDTDKIKAEKTSKVFCNERVRSLASRIRSLSFHYKNAQIILSDYPSPREIDTAIKEVSKTTSMQVSAWKMTEDNFELTDEKAALQIFVSATKSLWTESPEVALSADNNMRELFLGGETLTFRLPALWSDTKLNTAPSLREKELAGFTSPDKSAMIRVLNMPLDNAELNEFVWKWVSRGDGVPVTSKWGTSGTGDFFYCVARRNNGIIRECYAVKIGDDALVFEGESTNGKFNFFTGKLEAVFKSLIMR